MIEDIIDSYDMSVGDLLFSNTKGTVSQVAVVLSVVQCKELYIF